MVGSMFKSVKFWVIILVIVSVLAITYLFFGYSTLTIRSSDSSSTSINDTPVLRGSGTIKLRPGVYKVSINSKDFESSTNTYRLFIFSNKKVSENTTARDFGKVINTALGANENTFQIINSKNFGVYYAASVSSLNQDKYVVLKYQDDAWGLLYEGRGAEQAFTWNTPTEVSEYLKGIKLDADSQ